jgi:hypothetical protein
VDHCDGLFSGVRSGGGCSVGCGYCC